MALHELDATALSMEIESGSLSALDLMRHTLDRIESINPIINAIVSLRDREELLREAEQADSVPVRGWLHGIPVAIKDLVDTEGITSSYGSPLFARQIPLNDDPMVSRLKAAGAIVIGKTNTSEFGLGSHTYNLVFGTTTNPYDPGRSAGGSSGGAAAALAARLLALADGSDMMGSLRNPAAFCNVYGLRPTSGLVPGEDRAGKLTGLAALPLATRGPLARSILDLARLLDTLIASPASAAASTSGDPLRRPDRAGRFERAVRAIDRQPQAGRHRIGWLHDVDGYYPMETGVLALCENALGVFDSLDIEIVTPALAVDPERLWQAWNHLRSVQIADEYGDWLDDASTRDCLKPEFIWEIEQGRRVGPGELQLARSVQRDWWLDCRRLFAEVDTLALPSAQLFPFPSHWAWPRHVGMQAMRSYHEWMAIVIPASIIGLPSLNVPVGFNEIGLPMGTQLIGRRHADANLLQLGERYHRASGWRRLAEMPTGV